MVAPDEKGALNSFPSRNLAPEYEKSRFERPVKHFLIQGQKSHFLIGFSGMVLKPGWRLHSINQTIFFKPTIVFRGHRSRGVFTQTNSIRHKSMQTISSIHPYAPAWWLKRLSATTLWTTGGLTLMGLSLEKQDGLMIR